MTGNGKGMLPAVQFEGRQTLYAHGNEDNTPKAGVHHVSEQARIKEIWRFRTAHSLYDAKRYFKSV